MSSTSTTPTISIDLIHDLDSTSAITQLFQNEQGAILSLTGQLLSFDKKKINEAAANKISAQLSLTAPLSGTLPNGIGLSLAAGANCKISIANVSETFAVATTLDSSTTTKDITAIPPDGNTVYINIDLDFSIQGSASGSGAVGPLGISGTLAGGVSATFSFCQPVDGSLLTFDAIRKAFSEIIFPLDPTRLLETQTGSLSRVIFNGTFSAELDVTYGLGDHTFAAPGVAAALASAQKVVSITPPSVKINAGATASVTYTHTDHFALVVDKSADMLATVYLIRALDSDTGFSAGFKAGITTTNVSVAIDQGALQSVVKDVTKSDTLAAAVVNAASIPLNNLVTNLNSRLASWASDVTGEIGLSASLARQKNHTALFVFEADLKAPNLTNKGWPALISGDLVVALNQNGLTLQPGSGVSESLKRSSTFNFQFFNLFSFTNVTDFFSKATAELGADGTIRLQAAIGDETKAATKSSFSSFRIYFVVGATSSAAGNVTTTDVDLRLELSEANHDNTGATYADTLSLAPVSSITTATKQALAHYLGGHPGCKLTLLYDLKPTVYSKLAFSPYNAGKPGPLPHSADQNNWTAFRDATTALERDLSFVSPFTYASWVSFNRACIDQPGSTIDPDRRQTGAIASGLTVLPNSPTRPLSGFFLQASQGFMNLCEDLCILADEKTSISDLASYNSLLGFITNITTNDIFIDYALPTAGALLHQCANAGGQIATSADLQSDDSSITCTITLS